MPAIFAPTPASTPLLVASVVAFLVNTVVTFVSMTGIFGKTNSELSEEYQTIITPAGYAFSIWGLIFTTEGIAMIIQFVPKFRPSPLVSQPASIAWIFACLFQTGWTPAFAQEHMLLSLILMIGIWISLLVVVLVQEEAHKKTTGCCKCFTSLLLQFPFRLHFGWISCALVVMTNVFLTKQYPGDASVLYPAAVVSLVLLGGLVSFFAKNAVLASVAAWALFAVHSELSTPKKLILDTFDESSINAFQATAKVTASVVLALAVCSILVRLCDAKCNRESCKKPEEEVKTDNRGRVDAYVRC